MGLVQGSDVLLRISNGGALNAVGCNASCTLEITTDTYETTFEESGSYRSYIPNKHSAILRGNGPIILGEDLVVSDIVQYQLNKTVITWEFRGTDNTDTFVYSGNGFFTQCTIDGAVGQAAQCDYTIQVTGEISVVAAPPLGDGEPQIYTYEATGGETTVSDADLIGVQLLDIEREGIGLEIITVGTPDGSQVKFETLTGTLTFGTMLFAGEWVNALYLE
jgi:hypothetical protein